MKKLLVSIVAMTTALIMLTGCVNQTADQPVVAAEKSSEVVAPSSEPTSESTEIPVLGTGSIIALAADQGGINDKAINEGTYKGMVRAQEEFGFDLKVIESRSADDYEPTLDSFVNAGARLIIGVGSQMPTSITTVANRNPDTHFVSMDAIADAPNVKSFVFREQEGSFLAGLIAGLMTKTNKVGFIGGKDIEVINRFEVGFAAGVMCVNALAAEGLKGTADTSGVTVKFVDSFSDSNKAYELAKSLYADGCDIVYHAAGGAGIGVFQAAKEINEAGTKVWAIGVDRDQAVVLPEFAEFILTSMVKRTDEVAYSVIQEELEGNFVGGVYKVGLAENAVGLAESSSVNVPQDILAKTDVAAQLVKDGVLVIPATRAELASFVPVEIK